MKAKIFLGVLAILLVSLFAALANAGGDKTLKFGTFAPEGSAWYNILREFTKGVSDNTGGAIKFRIFPQTRGDEKTILKLMRARKLEGAAFMGVGLGDIYSGIRILEQPMLYRSYAEVDFVADKLWPFFEERFEKEGFILLGRGEAGFVNVFSNAPIAQVTDFKGVKLWVMEGDPVAKGFAVHLGIVPVYLALPDVLTALQTNRIDACYAPPLAAMAMQWHSKVKYYTDIPLVNTTGGFVITKAAFEALTPEQRDTMRRFGAAAGKKMLAVSRRDNQNAYKELEKQGIKKVSVTPQEYAKFEQAGLKVSRDNIGTLYDKELLERVEGYLKEFRAAKPKN